MTASTPYLQLKVAYVGLIQLGVTVYLVSMSLSHLNDPTSFPDINTHRKTLWALKNYKINEYGVKYFNYSDPETGEKFDGVLSDTWFDERFKGRFIYFYGHGYDNYCWPRKIPTSDWLPSLFRSSQLKPWVQVPLRAAILLGMTFRIFQAIVLVCMRIHRSPNSKLNSSLGKIFVVNELFHNVALFYVSNYLVTPDQKYLFLFGPCLIIAFVTFGLKMLFSLWHSGLHVSTALRLAMFFTVSNAMPSNYRNCLDYLHYNYCDHYVPPIQAFNEMVALFCLLVAELLDIIQTWTVECVLGGTEEECGDEEKIREEARTSM